MGFGLSARAGATGAFVVAVLFEHAIEEIGDAGRSGRSGGQRRRSGSGKGRARRGGSGARDRFGKWVGGQTVRAEIGGEFWREEFGEEGGVGYAELFGAKQIEQIFFVNAVGAVERANGGEGLGEIVVEGTLRSGGGVFAEKTDLPAEPGKLGARGVNECGKCGSGGGQNSSR